MSQKFTIGNDNTVNVKIPEVYTNNGGCGACLLATHTYEDTQKCVVDLAGGEVSIFNTLFPGPKCPRYEESQTIRKLRKE